MTGDMKKKVHLRGVSQSKATLCLLTLKETAKGIILFLNQWKIPTQRDLAQQYWKKPTTSHRIIFRTTSID
jgi:hypothetical protein